MTDLPVSKSGRTAIEVATEAIRLGGDILLAHAQRSKEVKEKSKNNLVTDVDILSEKAISNALSAEYPGFNILSEESAPDTQINGYTWIIDPLAGTNNYAFGIPLYAINIALARDKDVLLGMTYNPVADELFQAVKGNGAYLNDTPIRVSNRASLSEAVLGFDTGYDVIQGKLLLNMVSGLWPRVHSLRALGSASLTLAYIACGRVDIYIRGNLHPWDIASGILLVEEAGGKVTNWQGKKEMLMNEDIAATNKSLHKKLLRELE
jgi:myo-inositol-1(or 4)-monophosphatase